MGFKAIEVVEEAWPLYEAGLLWEQFRADLSSRTAACGWEDVAHMRWGLGSSWTFYVFLEE